MPTLASAPPLLLAALLLGAPRAQDSLADLVPAGAKFACYFDLQATLDFVGRDLVQDAVARLGDEQGGISLGADWNTSLAKEWGIDPLRDLEGLLVFGDDLHGGHPNVVLLTSDKIDVLLDKLHDIEALTSERLDGVTVERLTPGRVLEAFGVEGAEVDVDAFVSVQKLDGRLRGRRALVFGATAADVVPATAAMRGAKASERAGALTLQTRRGCIAYLEVADVLRELMDRSPASRMANKATHLSLQLSEDAGEISFAAAVETESAKDARQIAALVNGLKALVSLVEPSDDVPEGVLEALDRAHAESDGNRVSLQFTVPRRLVDEARRHIREELGGADEPRAGSRTKRLIR